MTDTTIVPAKRGTLPDLIEDAGEVLVQDLILAERLGFARPRAIRQLIQRHASSLEEIGNLFSRVAKSGGRGRPSTTYYLTEAQALFIMAKSDTMRANSELAHVAQVFTEYRRGNLFAKDADTQARLDAAEEARQARRALHLEEKEARSAAFLLMRRR